MRRISAVVHRRMSVGCVVYLWLRCTTRHSHLVPIDVSVEEGEVRVEKGKVDWGENRSSGQAASLLFRGPVAWKHTSAPLSSPSVWPLAKGRSSGLWSVSKVLLSAASANGCLCLCLCASRLLPHTCPLPDDPRTDSLPPSCAMQLYRNIWHSHTGIIPLNGAAVVFLFCPWGWAGGGWREGGVRVDHPASLTSLTGFLFYFLAHLDKVMFDSQDTTSLFRRPPTEAKWRKDAGNCFGSHNRISPPLSFSVHKACLYRFYAILSASENG